MICFSFDIDWAPEAVIEDLLNLLASYKTPATLFATHRSELLVKEEVRDYHEIGIHPNFNRSLNGNSTVNFQQIIDDLRTIYPAAVGLRSHSLAHSCPILIYCLEKNFIYDSNIYVPFGKNITPFDYFGLIRIPYNWEDDGQWVAGKDFSESGLDLNSAINILSFHPIHVYLNTPNQAYYESVKEFYQVPEKLINLRNTRIPGTRDLLISLLEYCESQNLERVRLKDYAVRVKSETGLLQNTPLRYHH
jgi:hypothetical protein